MSRTPARKRSNKYGIQPLGKELARQRWTVAAAARQLGVEYPQLYNAVTGRITPTIHLRNALPTLLDVPLEKLFTVEVLKATPRTQRARRKAGE